MNYKLLLELKKAGFSQVAPEGEVEKKIYGEDGAVYVPRLSELIDACGDKFDCLMLQRDHKPKSRWICNHMGDSYGKTPEECVAKLWLKLNANK